MSRHTLILALALGVLTGCPPVVGIAPQTPDEALSRVNQNLERINRPVQYRARAAFRFRDESGASHRLPAQDAVLLFAPPKYLRFDILSLGGVVAQIGSDPQRYWLWIEPEVRKLWWGYWDSTSPAVQRRLAIPPADLLDALLLRPLPATTAGGMPPMLRVVGSDHRLLFVRLSEAGKPSGWREIRLDPLPPYQPLEITERLADGRVQMQAELSRYAPLESGGPLAPRRFHVRWPLDDAEIDLNVTKAGFRTDLPTAVFAFPEQWRGEVEQLDAEPVE